MTYSVSILAALVVTLTLAIAACAAPPSPDTDGARDGGETGAAASEPADPGATTMPDAADQPPCYRLTELAEDQMQIDCADGQAFVVRRDADGRWTEERKAHAGVPTPSWERAEDAAIERCGCGG